MSASSQDDPPPDAPPPYDPSAPGSRPLEAVLELVRYLRRRCPWDAAQTPRSLLPYLLEEAHEVAHHVEDEDDDALAAELGDLLLHVAFQVVLAEERGAFSAGEVVGHVDDKMRRRHPHLFGLGPERDWEELKAAERAKAASERTDAPSERADSSRAAAAAAPESHSLLHGLAPGLDALSRAHRIQDRVAAVGFDWDDARGAFGKVAEEMEEVRALLEDPERSADELEEEIGDLLFAAVNLARLSGVHGHLALGAANRKFTRRFQALERLARERAVPLGEASLEELDVLWDEVKAREE